MLKGVLTAILLFAVDIAIFHALLQDSKNSLPF